MNKLTLNQNTALYLMQQGYTIESAAEAMVVTRETIRRSLARMGYQWSYLKIHPEILASEIRKARFKREMMIINGDY